MISIAAGTHTKSLFQAWGAKARIIRAMPNTPGAIGHGITGLVRRQGRQRRRPQTRRSAAVGAWAKPSGSNKEDLIDSVTAVSGSGPAYLFLMAEALTAAGIAEGLPRAQAEKLARATVSGAGALAGGRQILRRRAARSRHQPRRHHRSGAESADGEGWACPR